MKLFRRTRVAKRSNWIPHEKCDIKDRAEHLCVAEDTNGYRYTEHVFAKESDPWYGAKILNAHDVAYLEAKGLLPLREITE